MKVLYIGHYKEDSGWSRAAINNILALDAAGVNVVCRDIKLTNKPYNLPNRIIELEKKSARNSTHCIQNVLPHHFMCTDIFKKNIAYNFSESITTTKNIWHLHLEMADEVWVTNTELHNHVRRVIKNKIKVIHQAVDTSIYNEEYNKINFGNAESDFKFYFIGDLNDRKNLKSLIRCYYRAFSANDSTLFLVKVKKHGVSEQALDAQCRKLCEEIQREMRIYADVKKYPAIQFITSNVDDEFIYALHKQCDCFLGASHGEAWSLPAFDAMCFGSTPICSNEGGPKEFIDPKDRNKGTLISGTYGICNEQNGAFSHLFTGSELWFNPSEEAICVAMKYYYGKRHEKDVTGCEKYGEEFNLRNIGYKMKELLHEQNPA